MSDSLAVSVPHPAPSVAGSWIKANALAALINTAMGLVALLLAHAFGTHNPDAGSFGKFIAFLAYVAAGAAGFSAFATLNGRVLREKIPAFPLRTWIIAHLVIGVLSGLYGGYSALQPLPDMSQVSQVLAMPGVWIGMLFAGILSGVVMGLVIGGFQAFIMREVAQGLGAWVGFWVLAGVLTMFVYGLVLFMGDQLGGLTSQIMGVGLGFLSAIVTTIVMLPAVAWLAPRQHAA